VKNRWVAGVLLSIPPPVDHQMKAHDWSHANKWPAFGNNGSADRRPHMETISAVNKHDARNTANQ